MYICDDSDVTINVTDPKDNAYDKKLAFENNAQVIFWITKISNTLVDNEEDLDIVMSMYSLIEHSKIIQKQQEVFGITTKMNQIVVQYKI